MINKLFIDGREPPPPPPPPPPRSLTVYRTDLSTNRIVRRSLNDHQDYPLLSLDGVLMTHTCVDKNIILLTHLAQISSKIQITEMACHVSKSDIAVEKLKNTNY